MNTSAVMQAIKILQTETDEETRKAAVTGLLEMLEQDEDMAAYIKRLKEHDWSYDYSDDHFVWGRGLGERIALNKLQRWLDPDHILWNMYAPEDFRVKS